MNKELESLKFIKNVEVELGNDLNTATKIFEINHEYDKAFEIVESGLERLEKYDALNLSPEELQFVSIVLRDPHSVAKKVKALEIIREKRVNVQLLKNSINLVNYNWCNGTEDRELTEKEFELLKEVLL